MSPVQSVTTWYGQAKELQAPLRLGDHALELVHRVLGLGKLDHLHLVELVHANDATSVAAGRARLLAKARGERGVPERQLVTVENLAPVDVGEHDLSRGNEVHAAAHVIEVLVELGQLARAKEGVVVGDDGRPPLGETSLHVGVDEEVDERALHEGARAAKKVEARAGELDAALEVDHAGSGAKVPVRLGLEVELRGLAPATNLGVIGVVNAIRHGLVGDVGDCGDKVEQVLLDLGALVVKLGDAVLAGSDLGLCGLGLVLLALAHELANLLGDGVAVRLQLLHLRDDRAALLIELEEALAIPVRVLARCA
jgi:hypothetical protein